MSYRLHYAMLLPVDGLIDEGGVDLTAKKAAAALRAMADGIEAHPEKMKDIFGSPLNAAQEDRWVIRAATEPSVIRKCDAGWVHVDPADIDLEDSLTSEVIAGRNLNPGPDALWVRPENIGGLPVIARMRDRDGNLLGQLDLRDWMAWADEEVILDCIEAGWDFSRAVEDSTPHHSGKETPDPLADDANLIRLDTFNINYGTRIDAADVARAIRYLDELRPGFIDRIGARENTGSNLEI